jgi:hypothetical protein
MRAPAQTLLEYAATQIVGLSLHRLPHGCTKFVSLMRAFRAALENQADLNTRAS